MTTKLAWIYFIKWTKHLSERYYDCTLCKIFLIRVKSKDCSNIIIMITKSMLIFILHVTRLSATQCWEYFQLFITVFPYSYLLFSHCQYVHATTFWLISVWFHLIQCCTTLHKLIITPVDLAKFHMGEEQITSNFVLPVLLHLHQVFFTSHAVFWHVCQDVNSLFTSSSPLPRQATTAVNSTRPNARGGLILRRAPWFQKRPARLAVKNFRWVLLLYY